MSYKKVFEDIKKDEFSNMYLIYGREKYLFDSLKETLLLKYKGNSFKEFNFQIVDAGETAFFNIIDTFDILPFMDKKRIIIIKNCPYFNSIKNGISDFEIEKLIEYFKNPSSTTVIFFFAGVTVDKKRKLYKGIKKYGEIIEFNKLDEIDLSKWIQKEVKRFNKKIDKNGIKTFISNLSYLNKNSTKTIYDVKNELNKLINLVGDKKDITANDVNMLVENSLETDIFELVDNIGSKNAKNAILIFNNLVDRGESEFLIFNMISRQFRMLKKTLEYYKTGLSISDIASKLSLPPFVIKKYIPQSRKFNSKNLSKLIKESVDIEYKIKTGMVNPKLQIELLIISACNL